MSRLQEMAKEWAIQLLITKLDVQGAFDRLSRQKVIDLFMQRTEGQQVGIETRFLLGQLAVNHLHGEVPGGHSVDIHPNVGIKQGAPESAEVLGLVMGMVLDDVRSDARWKSLPLPIADLPVDLM